MRPSTVSPDPAFFVPGSWRIYENQKFQIHTGGCNLVRSQLIGDPLRAASLHAQIEDTFDNSGSFFIIFLIENIDIFTLEH